MNSSNSLFALSFTDADGAFSVPVTASFWGIEADHRSLGQIGYVGLYDEPVVNTSTGTVANVVIALPRATSLIYGTVKTPSDTPIENIEVDGDDNGILRTRKESNNAGRYALGITAGNWQVELNGHSLAAAGYLGLATSTNIGLEDGQAVEIDLIATPFTAWLTGVVLDDTGAPLTDSQLRASDFNGGYSSGLTDGSGRFRLGVIAGTWHVQLDGSDDEPAFYAYPAAASFEVSDGVTVSNIEYRVLRTINTIAGFVLDELSNAVPDIELYARADIGGVSYRTKRGLTQPNGAYTINVSTGLWHVGVECFRVQQRGYVCPPPADILVSTSQTNVDFTLLPRSEDPSVLNLPTRLANGQFRFQLDGPDGWQYQVQVSEDLINWMLLDTDVLNPPVDIIDPNATGPRRFYRVIRNNQ
jgi:hypothetical protein